MKIRILCISAVGRRLSRNSLRFVTTFIYIYIFRGLVNEKGQICLNVPHEDQSVKVAYN